MPRYRLRHGSTEIELPNDDFVIGRSTACHLTLDDPLISRRHARIFVEGDDLFLEDLGSRNGYVLNGVEGRNRQRIRHLDRIRIGNADMVILDDRNAADVTREKSLVCKVCGSAVKVGDRQCPMCGNAVMGSIREHATVEIQLPLEMRKTAEPGRAPSAFSLVGSIASKALALGRVDEAERMVGGLLEQTLQRIEGGETIEPGTLREASDFALKLLDGPSAAKWITWLLRVHEHTRRVPDIAVVDALHEAARRVRYTDARQVGRLVEVYSQNPHLTPADRFVVKRLEALQRVVSA